MGNQITSKLRDRQCHVLTERKENKPIVGAKITKVRFSSKVKPQAEVATMVKTRYGKQR